MLGDRWKSGSAMINVDKFRERLRERREDSTATAEYCLNCGAQITAADIKNNQTCTQCGSVLESDNEDLREDG
jgi:ribosomal protein S27AE